MSAVVLVIVTASDTLTPISISRLDSLNVCGDVKVWIAKIASEVTSLVERVESADSLVTRSTVTASSENV